MNRRRWGVALFGAIGLLPLLVLPGCEEKTSKPSEKEPRPATVSQAAINKKKGEEFLAANAKKPGVKTTDDGLQYLVLKEGTGKMPKATDVVVVNYHGTTVDGKDFDSSVKPVTFKVDGFIPGWTEALKMMKEGSKWRVFIPSELAYKKYGVQYKLGPNETLIFEIELLKVK